MSQSNGAAAVFSERTRVTLSDLTMKKRTITETLLEECPNCGAARIGDETVCGFCGTSMVNRTAVTEEVIKEEEQSSNSPVWYGDVDGKAVTVVHPAHWRDTRTIILFVLAGICFLTGIVSACCLSLSTGGKSDNIFALLGLLLVAPFGLVLLTYAIVPVKSYKWFLQMAEEYDATVIRMMKVFDPYSRLVTVMKVSFVKDGARCIVQAKMPGSVSTDQYESGSTIKVKAYADKLMICTEEEAEG